MDNPTNNPPPIQVPPPPPPTPPAPRNGGFPTVFLVGVVLIVLVALGAGYMFLAPGMMGTPNADTQTAMSESQRPASETDAVAAELESFSTAELSTELDQIEQELAQ